MRKTFANFLYKQMEDNSEIWLLIADVGWGIFNKIFNDFPERAKNVGVAEQNMMNIATGLAMCGKVVFTYTMSTFVTMRPYEQIRNNIAYNNLRVRIIGIGGRDDYPTLGFSHNCPEDEDLKIMALLPNMKVYYPKSKKELKTLIGQSLRFNHPIYIRINR